MTYFFLLTKVYHVHFLSFYVHVWTFDTMQMDDEYIHYKSDKEQVICINFFVGTCRQRNALGKSHRTGTHWLQLDQRATYMYMENLFFFVTWIHKIIMEDKGACIPFSQSTQLSVVSLPQLTHSYSVYGNKTLKKQIKINLKLNI